MTAKAVPRPPVTPVPAGELPAAREPTEFHPPEPDGPPPGSVDIKKVVKTVHSVEAKKKKEA